METKKEIINFKGHKEPITSVAFNNAGTILASGSYGKSIKI